jgi:hypothetical protein
VISAHHTDPFFQELISDYYLYCDGNIPLLFTENETNNERLFGSPNVSRYVKDGIHNYVVHGDKDAVNPVCIGTKAAADFFLTVGTGEIQVVHLRLSVATPRNVGTPFDQFDQVFSTPGGSGRIL